VRALDCAVCGEIIQGEDDSALVETMREHVEKQHGGEGEDEIERRVEADAYAPPTGEPPWAY
jgi:hypothetical protein